MIYDKGRPVLYVTLKNTLYGCLISVSLFYEHIVEESRGRVFELNPYEPCVANKIIGCKQMTVFWYVDDLKVSYVEPKEVTNLMEWIEGIYSDLSITRVKVHEYLGVTPDFWNPGELQVTMVYYLKGFM